MNSEMLKEYLVGLGFKIDDAGVRKFNDTLKRLADSVENQTAGMSKMYVGAAATVVTSLASVITSTIALMDTIAQADLGYQKYALRMHMTRDAARQLKIVTDAMGESLEDIAWIPELNERYRLLMTQATGMETPKDAAGQLRHIRDIRFEFTRLKVEVAYGMQWVGYHLYKHLFDPIGKSRLGFKEFNDYITEKIPEWSEKIAKWLAQIITLGRDAIRPLEKLKEMFEDLWKVLTPDEKLWAMLIGAGGLFALSGPFGRAVVLISGLILLINDFYVHMRGGKAALGDVWDGWLDTLREIEWHFFRITKLWSAHVGYVKGTPGAPTTVKELNEMFSPAGTKKIGEEFLKYEVETPLSKRPSQKEFYVKPKEGTGATRSEITEAAEYVSKRTGIPADLIYGQWYFETGGFTSKGFLERNNIAGIMMPGGEKAGQREFKSVKDSADYYAGMIEKNFPLAMGTKSPEDLARGLQAGTKGMYSTSMATYEGLQNYSSGISKGQDIYHVTYHTPITIQGVTDPEAAAKAAKAEFERRNDVGAQQTFLNSVKATR